MIEDGREPYQLAWYRWVLDHVFGKNVLDVGAGLCEGLGLFDDEAAFAVGLDNDPRLFGRHPRLLIGDISAIPSDSFDVVTAFDVLEHVVDDLRFFRHLRRVAKSKLFITTPNRLVSECRNPHHCREYSPAEFRKHFNPIWLIGADEPGAPINDCRDKIDARAILLGMF